MDAAPEGLRGLGRAPGLADDAPAAPSSSGRRVRLRTELRAVDLLGLPEVIHEAIATRVDPRGRTMLASSHPALRHSLRGFSTSDRAAAQGRQVNSLADFRAVLQDVQSLPERPDLQARPLAVLAGRVGALPSNDAPPAFDQILETIMQAPAAHRGPMDMPLMMLAGQMNIPALAEQPGAFQRLLRAQEPPGSQADVLHLLAGRIEDLPEAARQPAFMQVLQRAARLEPGLQQGVATALVDQLHVLPQGAQWPAFSGLLQDCSSLAPEQRAVMLKALTDEIGSLSEPIWLPAVRGVLAAAESLAPEQRWAVLKPLGHEVHRLPEAEQSSTWRAIVRSVLAVPPEQLAAALAAMTDQIKTLEDDEDLQLPAVPLMPAVLQESLAWLQRGEDLPLEPRTTMLLMLARGLADLPPAARPVVFRLALRSIPLLEQEHRGPLLTALTLAIAALPQADRQPAWQFTLQAVEQLPPPHGVLPLATLAVQIGGLPMDAQAAAFESLLPAHRRLPAQYHGLSMEVLGTGCLALPRAQWPHALELVLGELAQLPVDVRESSVLRLASKFCLAEPAANGPIDP